MNDTTFKALFGAACGLVTFAVIVTIISVVNSFNTVHTVIKQQTRRIYVTHAPMTDQACRRIRRGESQQYIEALYGQSDTSGNPKNPEISVDWPNNLDFYNTTGGHECDVYFDAHGKALLVYAELLANG